MFKTPEGETDLSLETFDPGSTRWLYRTTSNLREIPKRMMGSMAKQCGASLSW